MFYPFSISMAPIPYFEKEELMEESFNYVLFEDFIQMAPVSIRPVLLLKVEFSKYIWSEQEISKDPVYILAKLFLFVRFFIEKLEENMIFTAAEYWATEFSIYTLFRLSLQIF